LATQSFAHLDSQRAFALARIYNVMEPALLKMYDEILPQIDCALGE
jgi:hypothetical protein